MADTRDNGGQGDSRAQSTDDFLIHKDVRTLAASVGNSLREAIVTGRMAPGAALGQEFLADLFGVSRVPVREALRQLCAEGLVEIVPHKGAVVARLSLDELDELYGIVWSLERMAAPIGVPRLTDAQIAAMKSGLEKLRVVKDPAAWYQASSDIHRVMVIASGWTRCLRMIDECRKNIARYIAGQEFFSANVGTWLKRNEALVKACSVRDVDGALQALDVMRKLSTSQVRRHVEETLEASGSGREMPGGAAKTKTKVKAKAKATAVADDVANKAAATRAAQAGLPPQPGATKSAAKAGTLRGAARAKPAKPRRATA